jgi:D-aminopeptidase
MRQMVVRKRARELGIAPGILPPGPFNALTDLQGVCVGHVTVVEGADVRTGATAVLPHRGNLYQDKVPAGVVVGNGYGKLMGSTQLVELGEIEAPILLTNTLAVPQAAEAAIEWTLAQPGNERVHSVNPVVGETNDAWLNDIRGRRLASAQICKAIETARDGPVEEGAVGAGTGTIALGWKGGIGTSSRRLPAALGGYTVGVLVQSNFGGELQILGVPVGRELAQQGLKDGLQAGAGDGSIMMIVGTDAPLSDRNLTRLARRALAGLARTGAAMSNGSGDYAISFSTAEGTRRTPERRSQVALYSELPNERVSPLFQAAIEATEEAVYNSLFMATAVTGYRGKRVEPLPLDRVLALMGRYGRLKGVCCESD